MLGLETGTYANDLGPAAADGHLMAARANQRSGAAAIEHLKRGLANAGADGYWSTDAPVIPFGTVAPVFRK